MGQGATGAKTSSQNPRWRLDRGGWNRKSSGSNTVPEVGLEPTLPLREPDFESGASANSATPAEASGILPKPQCRSRDRSIRRPVGRGAGRDGFKLERGSFKKRKYPPAETESRGSEGRSSRFSSGAKMTYEPKATRLRRALGAMVADQLDQRLGRIPALDRTTIRRWFRPFVTGYDSMTFDLGTRDLHSASNRAIAAT